MDRAPMGLEHCGPDELEERRAQLLEECAGMTVEETLEELRWVLHGSSGPDSDADDGAGS